MRRKEGNKSKGKRKTSAIKTSDELSPSLVTGARDIVDGEEELARDLHRSACYFRCLINYRLFNFSAVAR